MFKGRYDDYFPFEPDQIAKESLAWFDRWLGPVDQGGAEAP